LADFIGVFDDLSDDPGQLALTADPVVRYASVRAPTSGGNCLACFEPRAIQNVRPGASWDLVLSGTPDYSIVAAE